MKRVYSVILIFCLFLGGWFWSKQEKPVIQIDKIKINSEEFEEAFRASGLKDKRRFLEQFISRKLILKEAIREGMDKDPAFLEEIQHFWEQALLKRMLSQKMTQLSTSVRIDDERIRQYYQKYKDTYFKDKSLSEVYDNIKRLLLQEEQRRALQDWVNSLKERSVIKIDYKSLGIDEKGGK